MNDKKPASQADHGQCKWCAGRGFITLRGGTNTKCPRCDGTGKAPKITTK